MEIFTTLKYLCLLTIATLAAAQTFKRPTTVSPYFVNLDNARYRTTTYRPQTNYYNVNEGQYQPDNSGAYKNNDGQYHPDESGQYRPDGAGQYVHQDSKYQHQGDFIDKYKHQGDLLVPYKGDKGSGNGGNNGNGNGNLYGNNGGDGSNFGVAVAAGQNPGLKQGNAAGLYDNRNYRILHLVEQNEKDGYHYIYETENRILGEEEGHLENKDKDDEVMRAKGFFEYTGPDNVEYRVDYTADERGFIPVAAHLPTPPPIPEAIVRSLEYQKSLGLLE